jgi:hypothetical protein
VASNICVARPPQLEVASCDLKAQFSTVRGRSIFLRASGFDVIEHRLVSEHRGCVKPLAQSSAPGGVGRAALIAARDRRCCRIAFGVGGNTMKTLLTTLVAVSVLVGVAATSAQAASFGSMEYWVDHNRHMN